MESPAFASTSIHQGFNYLNAVRWHLRCPGFVSVALLWNCWIIHMPVQTEDFVQDIGLVLYEWLADLHLCWQLCCRNEQLVDLTSLALFRLDLIVRVTSWFHLIEEYMVCFLCVSFYLLEIPYWVSTINNSMHSLSTNRCVRVCKHRESSGVYLSIYLCWLRWMCC